MLSVIILCEDSAAPDRPEAIVRTLVPLVGAAVKGLVRDVVVAGPRGRELQLIGDHAGCAIVEADSVSERLARGYAAAKGDTLMLLAAGHIPETGFFEEVEDVLAAGLAARGFFLRALPETLIEKVMPKTVGLIAPRAQCAGAGAASLRDLIAALKPRDLLRRRLRRVA
ncbi:MAG TPA: hypothetical protein VGG12_04840 [Methylovirgula sp.]